MRQSICGWALIGMATLGLVGCKSDFHAARNAQQQGFDQPCEDVGDQSNFHAAMQAHRQRLRQHRAACGPGGCGIGPGYTLPNPHRLAGPGPGVSGPGPGVLTPMEMSGGAGIGGPCLDFTNAQVLVVEPEGMETYWDTAGGGTFDPTPIIAPGRTNFQQAGIYRMKLTNIPGHEGLELYPTLEIGGTSPRTTAFLAHNAIPVQFTVDDLNQVSSGNFVTKVIYLPDPEFQELAVAGVETLVSTRLDPGVDPIVEADRRGAILAVLRVGNKDIEMPGMPVDNGIGLTSSLNCLDGQGVGSGIGPGGGGGYASMPNAISGRNGQAWGMPITGTPIGLPGPPHIPLGGPAGLQRHVIRNHTNTYMPKPTEHVKIHVKQHPRVTYPAPRENAWIHQYNRPNCGHCRKPGCHGQCVSASTGGAGMPY